MDSCFENEDSIYSNVSCITDETPALFERKKSQADWWLNLFNAELSPKGIGGDRDPRRWEKRETIPNGYTVTTTMIPALRWAAIRVIYCH